MFILKFNKEEVLNNLELISIQILKKHFFHPSLNIGYYIDNSKYKGLRNSNKICYTDNKSELHMINKMGNNEKYIGYVMTFVYCC